jgi:LuxR family maltose regulon positive regulatory protein
VAEAHRRASSWFERWGFLQEAAEHALGAEDFERAADLIERVRSSLMEQSANETLRRLLDRLPDRVMVEHPTLCVIKAWYLLDGGHLEQGERWLDAAEAALHGEVQPDGARNLQGEIAAARGFAATVRGDAVEAIAGPKRRSVTSIGTIS